MHFNRLFVAAIAASAFLLESCTTSTGNDGIDWYGMTQEEFERQPLDVKELMDTYDDLIGFYVNAETELMSFDNYVWQGPNNGFTADRYDFPDVSYMFSTVSDNFTNYFSPSIAMRVMNSLLYSEQKADIGAEVREVSIPNCEGEGECSDSTTVLVFSQVYPTAPADKAGIMVGDTLQSIDKSIIASSAIFERITTGKIGDSTSIVVKRGEESITVVATFAPYLAPTVFVEEIDSIPVITITEFTDTTYLNTGTYGEFLKALEQTEGATSTIIDLRGNPGGSTDHCINMAAELVQKNDTIVTMIERYPDEKFENVYIDTTTYTAERDGIGAGRYLVMLANSNSASCAELMLMGVTSNTNSPVVGETTYGKGIGQVYTDTYAGGVVGITSMRLLDKNRKSYHRYGIVPDYEISDSEMAMQKAVALAKEKTATRTQGYGTVDTGHFTLAKKQGSRELDRGAFKIIQKNKPIPFK